MTADTRVGIAFVIERLGRGGAERVLVSLANGLDEARYDVHVVTIRDPGELAGDLAPHVAVHALGRRRPWDLAAFLRFSRILRECRVDVVHTHSHMSAYFARAARALRGGRWLHVAHEHYPLIEQSPLRFADRCFLSRVDYCFAASSELTAYVSRWIGIPPQRCETLPNGTNAAGPIGSEPPGFTVVQVGRVTPQKDQLMALAVAARLRARLPSFRWLIVGRSDSAYAGTCRQAAEDEGLTDFVRFLGERTEVREILRRAHVGVLTSCAEALPLALLEYMAAGLPVVVTDVGDAGATVRASEGGRVVPRGDVEAFAEALLAYASDPRAAAREGAGNRRYVEATHGVEAMVARVAEVYDGLLAKRSADGVRR